MGATCGEEYGELAPHNYNLVNGYKGADGHANACSCGAHEAPVAHNPDRLEATETEAIKCTVCGYIITPATGHVTHTPEAEWESDANNHWHECIGCEGQQIDKALHADNDNDGDCDVCGYTLPVTPPSGGGNEGGNGGPGTPEPTPDTTPDTTPEDEAEAGLSGGAIAGIAVGAVAVAGVGGFAIFWFVIKKKSMADLLALLKKAPKA